MLINQEILQNPSPWNEYGGGCYKMKKLLIVLLFFGFSFGQSEEIVFSNQLKTNTLLEVFKETNFKVLLYKLFIKYCIIFNSRFGCIYILMILFI